MVGCFVREHTALGKVLSENQMGLCKYRPGDILYARETWAPLYPNETSNEIVACLYKADRDCFGEEYHKKYDSQYPNGKDYQWERRWRPSIHMPREAARIFLRVTDVRVERLQDITRHNAIWEGIDRSEIDRNGIFPEFSPRAIFSRMWDKAVKPADRVYYGWAANPWVWVIEFGRCKKQEENK